MHALLTMLAGWCLLIVHANGAPITWSLTPATLSNGYTVSGGFTYDKPAASVSNINISVTGTENFTVKFPGKIDATAIFAQQAASIGAGSSGVIVFISGIPDSPGTFTAPNLAILQCTTVTAGLCDNGPIQAFKIGLVWNSVVTANNNTIPTLGQYATLALAFLMVVLAFLTPSRWHKGNAHK